MDEFHLIGSSAAGPWDTILAMQSCYKKGVPWVIGISGTPVIKGPGDLRHILPCLKDPKYTSPDSHNLTVPQLTNTQKKFDKLIRHELEGEEIN